MHGIELFVALLLVATVLSGLARYINVHYAIVLVLRGLLLGLIPGLSTPSVDPNVVLVIFLPPLIYARTRRSIWRVTSCLAGRGEPARSDVPRRRRTPDRSLSPS